MFDQLVGRYLPLLLARHITHDQAALPDLFLSDHYHQPDLTLARILHLGFEAPVHILLVGLDSSRTQPVEHQAEEERRRTPRADESTSIWTQLDAYPTLKAAVASRGAGAAAAAAGGSPADGSVVLTYLPHPAPAPKSARLAYAVRVRQGTASSSVYFVDATDGTVLAVRNDLVAAEGPIDYVDLVFNSKGGSIEDVLRLPVMFFYG